MLKKIAKKAGVSLSTVSRILNKSNNSSLETKRSVIDAAREINYFEQTFNSCHCIESISIFINRDKIHKRDITIAEHSGSSFFSSFYSGILKGVTDRCNELKIKQEIFYFNPGIFKELTYSHFITNNSIDAAVFIGIDEEELPGIAPYLSNQAFNKPFIFINSQFTSQHFHNITPENYSIGLEAAEFLYQQGHRNILHLAMDHRLTLQRRTEGFRHFCESNIPDFSTKNNIIHLTDPGSGEIEPKPDHYRETEEKLNLYLEHHPLPDAIFACTDSVALSVIRFFYKRGMLIPNDLSLISVDNQYFCNLVTPKLTSIEIPNHELGVEAINELCYQSIFPSLKGKRVTLPGTLVQRESVKSIG